MRTRVTSILCAGLVVLGLLPAGTALSQENLTLVYTNSLNGYLDFCHCKADPNGGLVKRATEFSSIRKSFRNTLFVDTGDSFTYDPDPVGARYIVRAMKHIGYDAMAPGDQEFSIGTGEMVSLAKDLPFLCGNVRVNHGGKWVNPFGEYRLVEWAGVRTGIIGSMAPESFRFYPESVKRSVKVLDQVDAIRKSVRALEGRGAKLIILLSHSGYEKDLEIARAVAGIDLIVGGHSQTLLNTPVKSGNTLIVQAGTNGARIGILEISVEGGTIVSSKNSFRRPDEFRPEDDPFVRGLINEYREKLKKETGVPRFK